MVIIEQKKQFKLSFESEDKSVFNFTIIADNEKEAFRKMKQYLDEISVQIELELVK